MVKSADGNSAPVRLVKAEYLNSLSWSADGERIYYEGRDNGRGAIRSVARAGGEPVILPFDPQYRFRSPAVSPDGKMLAMLGQEQLNGKWVRRISLSSPPGSAPIA